MTPMRNPQNDGGRDRFLPPFDPTMHIECSCGRRVSVDDAVICPGCDKVLCDHCATELEYEIGCCEKCMPKHISKLERERNDALAGQRAAREEIALWKRRHRSMARFAGVLLIVNAALVWWRW